MSAVHAPPAKVDKRLLPQRVVSRVGVSVGWQVLLACGHESTLIGDAGQPAYRCSMCLHEFLGRPRPRLRRDDRRK